jgi:hypothetical protein
MGEPDNDPVEHGAGDANSPLTVDLLADLQAGLLDEETAARLRRQVRADPEAEALLRGLNQVRSDVAAAGADPAPISEELEPPPDVVARVSMQLRAPRSSGAAHSARPPLRRARLIAAIGGLCALLAAIGVGTAALLTVPAPTPSTPVTAEHITVPESASRPAAAIPLSQAQILDLLNRSPDYGAHGALEDPPRRESCLRGLGYPASASVLGAQPIELDSRPAVLLILPGDTPNDLAVFAVALNCSAVDTGLMASTQVPRA